MFLGLSHCLGLLSSNKSRGSRKKEYPDNATPAIINSLIATFVLKQAIYAMNLEIVQHIMV
jgi:hypothetical protein